MLGDLLGVGVDWCTCEVFIFTTLSFRWDVCPGTKFLLMACPSMKTMSLKR